MNFVLLVSLMLSRCAIHSHRFYCICATVRGPEPCLSESQSNNSPHLLSSKSILKAKLPFLYPYVQSQPDSCIASYSLSLYAENEHENADDS